MEVLIEFDSCSDRRSNFVHQSVKDLRHSFASFKGTAENLCRIVFCRGTAQAAMLLSRNQIGLCREMQKIGIICQQLL